MDQINNIPAEMLDAIDPTPDPPEPLRLRRQHWLDLVQRGSCRTETHLYIWIASGVIRLPLRWLGHPDAHRHWEDVVVFLGD